MHKMQEYILIQLIKYANRISDYKMVVHQQEKSLLCSTIVLILEEHLILCIYSRAALSLFYLYIIFAYSITLCVLFADDPQLHGTSGAH